MATPSTNLIQLPVIDISDSCNAATGREMLAAAVKYGFFYIHGKGSDFTAAEIDSTFAISKKFFALPQEEKETCRIRTDNKGWSGMHSEILDPEHQRTGDFKEALNFGEFQDGKAQQPLPTALQSDEAEIAHFAELCKKTCASVLRLLALGLEVDSEYFVTRHEGKTSSILRFLYYPSINSPAASTYQHDVDVRAGAHSDYGSITLLFQRPGQPGLEILTASETDENTTATTNNNNNNKWSPVPVWPEGATSEADDFPPILINIGDMLSFWTNGLLKSTIHRVVFPAADRDATAGTKSPDRYSVVYFCHPVDTCNLVPPVPSPLVAAAGADIKKAESGKVGFGGGAGSLSERRTMTSKEYLDLRLSATYDERVEVS